MWHPPFRVCVRGSKKVSPSSGALPEKERDHLHLQTAPFAAVQRQLQNNIKKFKIQRKKHPCVHRRTGAFSFGVLQSIFATSGQYAQNHLWKFGREKKDFFKQSI